MKTITKSMTTLLNKFDLLLTKGMESIYEACKLYAQALDEYEDGFDVFKHKFPTISVNTWVLFEKIGRHEVHYKLAFRSGSAVNKLIQLPYREQRKYLDEPIKLLLCNGDHLLVKLDNLTPIQSRQVFAKDHVRDMAEQKAWLEENKFKKANIKRLDSYKIEKHRLIIGEVVFTKDDLIKILGKM